MVSLHSNLKIIKTGQYIGLMEVYVEISINKEVQTDKPAFLKRQIMLNKLVPQKWSVI